MQPFGMFGQLEDAAIIDSLTFEHRRGIVQGVGQYVNLGFPPGYHLAVEPDRTRAIVEGYH